MTLEPFHPPRHSHESKRSISPANSCGELPESEQALGSFQHETARQFPLCGYFCAECESSAECRAVHGAESSFVNGHESALVQCEALKLAHKKNEHKTYNPEKFRTFHFGTRLSVAVACLFRRRIGVFCLAASLSNPTKGSGSAERIEHFLGSFS